MGYTRKQLEKMKFAPSKDGGHHAIRIKIETGTGADSAGYRADMEKQKFTSDGKVRVVVTT